MSGSNYNRSSYMRYGKVNGSKWTNRNLYDPWDLEVVSAEIIFGKRIEVSKSLCVYQMQTHPKFISPLRRLDVEVAIGKLPSEFKDKLEAIILLGGTNKQIVGANRRLRYGCYIWDRRVYIHAFPKRCLISKYRNWPKPSVLNEYKKAGALLREERNGLSIVFDKYSLRRFYEREVLMHEIGHHFDRLNFGRKTNKKIEGFADWFAAEYGYRLND